MTQDIPQFLSFVNNEITTPFFVSIPSLYAGLQGSAAQSQLPVQTSLSCPTPPQMIGGMLGYCQAQQGASLAQGQC